MSALRRIPLYRATTRPLLFLGGERELMLLLILVCTALIFITVSLVSIVIGVSLWVLGTVLLRELAKRDPQLSKVFLRYWNHFRQTYYAPQSRITSVGFRVRGRGR